MISAQRCDATWRASALVLFLLAACGSDVGGVAPTRDSSPTFETSTSRSPVVDSGPSDTHTTSASALPDRTDDCPEIPGVRQGNDAVLDLQTDLVLGGRTFLIDEANADESGATITPLDVRFYVSDVWLRRTDGTLAPADIATPTGSPVRYGVHLVVAGDPGSLSMRLLAPPGSYTGLRFTFGLSDACNRGSTNRNAPLGAASQMTWPHDTGYLFFRYQAIVGGDADAPSVIHMGGVMGQLLAPTVTAPGAFTLANTSPTGRRLKLVMDEIFRGATTQSDLSDFVGPPGEEVRAGERLRRSAPGLPIFVVESP